MRYEDLELLRWEDDGGALLPGAQDAEQGFSEKQANEAPRRRSYGLTTGKPERQHLPVVPVHAPLSNAQLRPQG